LVGLQFLEVEFHPVEPILPQRAEPLEVHIRFLSGAVLKVIDGL